MTIMSDCGVFLTFCVPVCTCVLVNCLSLHHKNATCICVQMYRTQLSAAVYQYWT